MRKEEAELEEPIWKKKIEDFIFMFCVFMVLFGTIVKTWMIFFLFF